VRQVACAHLALRAKPEESGDDGYSAIEHLRELKPYYDDLFAEFFPEKIGW
jgi:hypothetical protein